MNATEIQKKLDGWGIKRQWLADKLGVNKATLSLWLSGTKDMPQEYIDKAKQLLSTLGSVPV